MNSGEGGPDRQRVVYCVVPRRLAGKLHDHLRHHWRDDRSLRVVVEQRRTDRRREERRNGLGLAPPEERRSVRSASGRRIGERRAMTLPVEAPPLPRRAKAYADELVFIERFEPAEQALLDLETNRLVVQIQSGEPNAMTELYLLYFDRVYGYTRLALRDPHEAEDVTQQVFTNVLQALPNWEIRPSVPFRAWLFRIARNVLVDTLRQRARLAPEPPDRIGMRRESSLTHEADAILSWLTDSDLTLFLERLPVSQREVLVMRYLLDLEVPDIATVVERTPKAVRRLQERGLKTLEERLVAIGRRPERSRRSPMLIRLKPMPVMASRRWALANTLRPPQLGRSHYQSWRG